MSRVGRTADQSAAGLHLREALFDIVHEQRHSGIYAVQNHIQCADQVKISLTDSGDCHNQLAGSPAPRIAYPTGNSRRRANEPILDQKALALLIGDASCRPKPVGRTHQIRPGGSPDGVSNTLPMAGISHDCRKVAQLHGRRRAGQRRASTGT